MNWVRILVVCVLLFPSSGGAVTYSNFIDDGGWRTDLSVFECRMTHTIPYYGDAVFSTRAGEESGFFLHGKTSRLKAGQAFLTAQTPVWKEEYKRLDLGYIPVKQGLRPITLPTGHAERMLAELNQGFELVVTRRPWYGAEESSRLAITTIGFRQAYRQYLDCLAGLLPVNFDQIQRTAVYFGSSQYDELQPSEQQKLDQIVLYVKADPTVKEFFIDGHTDIVGTREDNLALAQKRAELVTSYLVNRGLPQEAIVTRWHGERYPAASNETREGRSKNRRVTIRLERITAPP